jgi:hypothetical protein
VDAKESLKIYIGHDPELDPEPDPHVFKSLIRIWSKIVRIRNTAAKFVLRITSRYGSGQNMRILAVLAPAPQH